MAISAIKSNIKKTFFCKKINHDVVVLVPNFQLSAKLSSFFCAFFLYFYGVLFLWTPYIYISLKATLILGTKPTNKYFFTILRLGYPYNQKSPTWVKFCFSKMTLPLVTH